MAALLFYEDVAVLDRSRHRHLKLKPVSNYAFAATTPAIPIVVGEFSHVAREYPIAFVRTRPDKVLPVALTGACADRNLFVDAQRRWIARYVPAFVRRYPFVFVETDIDRYAVCIDETWPGFGEEEGDPLFDAAGEPSAMLHEVFRMLVDYQRQIALTEQFTASLAAAGLLTEATARADLADGSNFSMEGFLVVDERKFRALPEATLKEWLASGYLGFVYAHFMALGNLSDLVRRLPQRESV